MRPIDAQGNPMRMHAGAVAWLVLLVALGAALPAGAAGRVFTGEFTLGHDDNVANARRGTAVRDDAFALASAAHETLWRLAPTSQMGWQLSAEGRRHDRHAGLSRIAGAARWQWLYRAGGGFHTPLIGAGARIEYSEFDSRLRDAWTYRTGLFVQQQLTTRLSWRGGWSARWVDARHAPVFEAGARSATLDLDWQLGRRVALYAGYQFLDGDLVSTAPAPPAAALAAARAAAPDDVFDGETAFRLASRAGVYSVGANLSLSPHWSVDVQWRRVEAEADTGTEYRREQALLSLLWRY
jgi:hypothetical protein